MGNHPLKEDMKKLLLILLLTAAPLTAKLHFDYEPELIALCDSGKAASVTDLIKVHNHALRWVYEVIEDHVEGTHKLTKAEVQYLEYISNMLADVANAIGYMPCGMYI